MKKGLKDVFYEIKKENMLIVFNMNFDFLISLNKEKIEVGDYMVMIDVNEGNIDKIWYLIIDFMI